jgi:hypothetical protein
MSRALVETDAALARILGVARTAVIKAEQRGKITRERDGRWDAVAALQDWRSNTYGTLQRPERAREFRPWLDPETPLTEYIWTEFVRRADAQGAEWDAAGAEW